MNSAADYTRWSLLFPSIFLAFVVSGFGSAILSERLHIWPDPTAGFVTASTVVVIAYLISPKHKLISALVVYILGAIVAWYFLKSEFYPENYKEKAYQHTWIPLIMTLSGGAACWIILFIVGHVRGRTRRCS